MQGHSGILPTTGGYNHTIRKDVSLFIREESLSKESLSRLASIGSHAHTWLQRNLGNELWLSASIMASKGVARKKEDAGSRWLFRGSHSV